MKYSLKNELLANKRNTEFRNKNNFNSFKLLQMLSSSEMYMVDISVPKYEYFAYTPQTILTENTVNGHLYIHLPSKFFNNNLKN